MLRRGAVRVVALRARDGLGARRAAVVLARSRSRLLDHAVHRGAVPMARSLSSALDRRAVGDTRVVCQGDSLRRAKASIARARSLGFDVRPTDHRRLSAHRARSLLQITAACSRAVASTRSSRP